MVLPYLGKHRATVVQASRFAVVGVINTFVDLALFSAFFYLLSWPLLGANAAGFIVSAIGSYFMNKFWTFGDRSRGRQALRRGIIFVFVATGGLAIGSLIIWLAAMVLAPILAKLTAIGGTFAWNFTVSRRWVFRT